MSPMRVPSASLLMIGRLAPTVPLLAIAAAMLVVRTYYSGRTTHIAAGSLLLTAALGISNSEHETSMLSLVSASITFVGVLVAPKIT